LAAGGISFEHQEDADFVTGDKILFPFPYQREKFDTKSSTSGSPGTDFEARRVKQGAKRVK
jgi:hypothetical protein